MSNIFAFFLTRLLALGILFSTAVNAAVAAKPVILGILPCISVILALCFFKSTNIKKIFCLCH